MKSYFIFLFLVFSSQTSFAQNNSAYFNGTTGYVEVPSNDLLNFTTEFTIEAWIKLDNVTGTQAIVHKGWCGISDHSYSIAIANGKISHSWNADGNCNFSSNAETVNAVIIPARCTHIAVVHGTSQISFYVDGVLVSSMITAGSVTGIHPSQEPFRIGIYKFLSGTLGFPALGEIDEIRIWDVAKTQTEISNNFEFALSGNESNLVAYYNFENCTSAASSVVGNVALTGSQLNGLSSSTNFPTYINACEILTNLAVEENANDELFSINLFPNPGSKEITVSLEDYENVESIIIYSQLGEEISTSKPTSNETVIQTDLLNNSLYLITVTMNNGHSVSKKWMKTK